MTRQKLLLQGTVVFGNMLSHPVYGKAMSIIIESAVKKVTETLEELSKGELLNWDQQKELK